MPTPTSTQPTEPWKPTRAQVFVAARAIARLDDAGWRALTQAQRDDYLIDAHSALVESAKLEPPRVALHAPARQGDAMVCMTKEHADAYAALVAAVETGAWSVIDSALVRLRALTAAEKVTS